MKINHVSGIGYEGDFHDGVMHGQTICTLANGDIQIG